MKTWQRQPHIPSTASAQEGNLFPFLSIFLCVMGVLSFINILNSLVATRQVEMEVKQEEDFKVAYQVYCLPDGLIFLPPNDSRLDALKEKLSETPDKILEWQYLEEILTRRQTQAQLLQANAQKIASIAVDPEEYTILNLIDEISQINRMALNENLLYEEFILFGVYPDGGAAYQRFRKIMIDERNFSGILTGLEALDRNWQINIQGGMVTSSP